MRNFKKEMMCLFPYQKAPCSFLQVNAFTEKLKKIVEPLFQPLEASCNEVKMPGCCNIDHLENVVIYQQAVSCTGSPLPSISGGIFARHPRGSIGPIQTIAPDSNT